jgi:hypothetical protein
MEALNWRLKRGSNFVGNRVSGKMDLVKLTVARKTRSAEKFVFKKVVTSMN